MILNGKLEHEELKTLDDAAPALAPIFGSQASDASMPTDHFNMDPVEPRIASEIIREFLSTEGNAHQNLCTFVFGSQASDASMPTDHFNMDPVEPRIASEIIREFLSTEGNAHQNLCTFVQTYMEPEATELMAETLEKNAIDKDEYPMTAELENRCVAMIENLWHADPAEQPMGTSTVGSSEAEKNAIDKDEYPMTAELENRCVAMIENLWHADPAEQPMGTSTVGSSEACMLGGLAMLFRWKALAKEAGIDIYSATRPNLVISSGYQVCWEKFCRYWDIEMRLVPMDKDHLSLDPEAAMKYVDRPNLVISSGYQVCWEKFCRYWDIEMRLVPMDKDHLSLDPEAAMKYVDDHTIGVVAILGITYTGRYDDVKGLDAAIEAYNKSAKVPVRIHVDAASGGFVAPFIEPDLAWDFRLPNVWSISTSGHKYGLVYPGIGWVVWRSKEALPEDLIFWVSYLGGQEATMAINFSRSASQIVGQYYVFMRNGFNGYKEIQLRTMDVAHYLVGQEATMAINFSRSASQIVGQYYVFMRNGFNGYKEIQLRTMDVAHYLVDQIEQMGIFEMYEKATEVPILCWSLKEDANKKWSLYDLDDRLRMHGWQIPAYPLPANMEDVTCQRIVCRADLSMAMAEKFITDMKAEIANLDNAAFIGAKEGSTFKQQSFDHSGRMPAPAMAMAEKFITDMKAEIANLDNAAFIGAKEGSTFKQQSFDHSGRMPAPAKK